MISVIIFFTIFQCKTSKSENANKPRKIIQKQNFNLMMWMYLNVKMNFKIPTANTAALSTDSDDDSNR